MLEFQLTQVALLGARMSAFHAYGVRTREELAMHRIIPHSSSTLLCELSEQQLQDTLKSQLPLWIHNILADPKFPQRDKLLMPLRRFEGELRDNRDDEVVSAVLSAGFRNQTLDPLDLPDSMPMRQRCAIVMQLGIWQEAFRQLEQDLLEVMTGCVTQIDSWLETARQPGHALVE